MYRARHWQNYLSTSDCYISSMYKSSMVSNKLYWRLIELPYWFKARCWPKILEFITCNMQKITLREMRFNTHRVRFKWTSENSKKLRKVEFWDLITFKFSEFSTFSSVQFNLTWHWFNLTMCKPMWSQIDMRWDLLSHQSEILHSLTFHYIDVQYCGFVSRSDTGSTCIHLFSSWLHYVLQIMAQSVVDPRSMPQVVNVS